jgi:hypothetical protein
MASVGRPPKGKAGPAPANTITSPQERENNAPVANTITSSSPRENVAIENAITGPKES